MKARFMSLMVMLFGLAVIISIPFFMNACGAASTIEPTTTHTVTLMGASS